MTSDNLREITYSEAVREAMVQEMHLDKEVFLLGEDVGTYGGAFGVSKGMLEEFGPERVRDTPISEAAIAGAATGAALMGMRPIMEIMFMDFLTISMNQLVNQAAKMRFMFGGSATLTLGNAAPQHRFLPGYPALGIQKEQIHPQIDAFYRDVFPSLKALTHPIPEARRLVDFLFQNQATVAIATKPVFPLQAIAHRLLAQLRRPIGAAFRRSFQMNRFSFAAVAVAIVGLVAAVISIGPGSAGCESAPWAPARLWRWPIRSAPRHTTRTPARPPASGRRSSWRSGQGTRAASPVI